MADLRSKYVCNSAGAMVETHYFGVTFCYFSILWYDRKVPEYREFLRKIQPSIDMSDQAVFILKHSGRHYEEGNKTNVSDSLTAAQRSSGRFFLS